jgi:ATP-dependent Zn protease
MEYKKNLKKILALLSAFTFCCLVFAAFNNPNLITYSMAGVPVEEPEPSKPAITSQQLESLQITRPEAENNSPMDINSKPAENTQESQNITSQAQGENQNNSNTNQPKKEQNLFFNILFYTVLVIWAVSAPISLVLGFLRLVWGNSNWKNMLVYFLSSNTVMAIIFLLNLWINS